MLDHLSITTTDLDRAQSFYETILAQPLQRECFAGIDIAVFPRGEKPNATGALIRHDDCEPAVQGSIVYLSVDDLRPVLERAGRAGGDTLVERTALPAGMGYYAQFRDCEGNRVGLWSPA